MQRSRFSKNFSGVLLAAVVSVLLFLFTRLVLRNTLFALPLLTLASLLFSVSASGVLWQLILSGTLVLSFFFLEFTLNADKTFFTLPSAIFFACTTVGTAALAGHLLNHMRQERELAARQLTQERSVSALSAQLLTAADPDKLYHLTLRSLFSVTECPSVLFLPESGGVFSRVGSYPEGLLLYPAAEEVALCFRIGRPVGRGTGLCPESVLRFYPVCAEGQVLAVAALLTDGDRPLESYPLDTVEFLLMRAGIALDRMHFFNREQKILMEKETERIRSDFLRAISHDFRTPLTGILGACSTLEQTEDILDQESRLSLIHSVSEEASWLLRMVENLLTVTRVSPGGHKLNRSLEPLEEVLLEVLEKARARFPQAEILLTQPAELLLLPMDPMLMVQVLTNLIENAVKFAEEDHRIKVTVEEQTETVSISVRDYGRGLSPAALDNLFEPINHHEGDSNHGMGLGLSICKSIIRAHGGTIEGRNREDRGAEFIVTLPKEDTYES